MRRGGTDPVLTGATAPTLTASDFAVASTAGPGPGSAGGDGGGGGGNANAAVVKANPVASVTESSQQGVGEPSRNTAVGVAVVVVTCTMLTEFATRWRL